MTLKGFEIYNCLEVTYSQVRSSDVKRVCHLKNWQNLLRWDFVICLRQSNFVLPLQGMIVFLPPAHFSCNFLSSSPVVAFPLAKSYWLGSKLTLKKIAFSFLTWEDPCMLTSSGWVEHSDYIIRSLWNRLLQKSLSK